MQYPQQPEPLGKRIGRFVTLIVVLLTVVVGAVAYLKFDPETLALITGQLMIVGIALIFLTFALAFYYVKRRTEMYRAPAQPAMPAYQLPPLIIQAPQPALPNYGGPYEGGYGSNNGSWGFESQNRSNSRAWEIIGGEE